MEAVALSISKELSIAVQLGERQAPHESDTEVTAVSYDWQLHRNCVTDRTHTIFWCNEITAMKTFCRRRKHRRVLYLLWMRGLTTAACPGGGKETMQRPSSQPSDEKVSQKCSPELQRKIQAYATRRSHQSVATLHSHPKAHLRQATWQFKQHDSQQCVCRSGERASQDGGAGPCRSGGA